MHTDPITAAGGYRYTLERIARETHDAAARASAEEALATITYQKPGAVEVVIEGGVSAKTTAPYITISMSEPIVQLGAEHGRQIGLQILDTCAAADADAALIGFLATIVSKQEVIRALTRLREYRARQRVEAQPSE